MFDFHKCLLSALLQKHSRRWFLLPTYFLHRGDAQSVPAGSFLREHFCLSHHSEAAVLVLCSAVVLGELLAAVILEQRGWKLLSQDDGILGFFQAPEKVHGFAKCSNAGCYWGLLSPLFLVGEGFFPIWFSQTPNLGAQMLLNDKSRRSQVLVFWWGDGHWLDGYLCLSLQPSQLSDAVISMVTQTPRLLTAACEEQHSAAQGSHDQVSQKESPNKSSPPAHHSLCCQVFPWWSHPGSQVLCTSMMMDFYQCCHLRL